MATRCRYFDPTPIGLLALSLCASSCQEGTWRELPDTEITVTLPDGEAVSDDESRITTTTEATDGTRVRVKLKKSVRTDAPGVQVVSDVSSELPRRSIRWIQIVVAVAPMLAPTATRPNFDGVMTKGEYEAQGQVNRPAREARERRLREHNPFHAEGRKFEDTPSAQYTRFETYLILVVITERPTPKQWKAEIGTIFHWTYNAGAEPTLAPVPGTDPGFQQALAGAKADFTQAFEFGKWYDGSPPSAAQ